jgi:hypothetical protein
MNINECTISNEESKYNRETRAADALRVKDDQIRLLSEQNHTLMRALDKVNNRWSIQKLVFNIYFS